MEDNQVSAKELKQAMAADFDRLAEEVVTAMNAAKDGHIIADTEELVRDANAVFREQMYARAISLLQSKQEAFSGMVQTRVTLERKDHPNPFGKDCGSCGQPSRFHWPGPLGIVT